MLRNALFRILRKISETDDARSIAAEMLGGLLQKRPAISLEDARAEPPYPELGTYKASNDQGRDAVFITGRFRSGSTFLWNVFRNIGGFTAYYEPFNERRWFDPTARGTRVDPTHRAVADYWREYEGLDILGDYYNLRWTDRNLFMDSDFWDPALKRFIEILLERSPRRPVFKFNRIDFRLPWVRSQFPGGKIIHIYRHPRDQWCSTLLDPKCFPKEGTLADFSEHDKFYLGVWARDLKHHFPFLEESHIGHPYQMFYYIWKLSYVFGKRYAHYSMSFEDLMNAPEGHLGSLFEFLGLVDWDFAGIQHLIVKPSLGRWRQYADDRWFLEQEVSCERVLAGFSAGNI